MILGITQERFTQIIQQEQRGLQHQDVEVLALEILEQSPGKIIEEKLKNLAERVGTPLQILSDRGSDLKKGIDLYLEGNPGVIFTYDVTHKMASLLKKELSVDERYQNFLHQCSLTRHRLQQTELYFLVPPKQRSKARYHNVDILVEWAQKVLKYQDSGDFSQISTTYSLDWETLFLLRDTLPRDALAQLMKLSPKVYENQAAFTQALSAIFGEEVWQLQGELICQAAAVGRRKFQSKLGWLSTYQQEIDTYAELMNLVKTVEKQVKVEGLHRHSHLRWSEAIAALSLSVRGQKLKQQISDYLAAEGSQIPEGRTLLGTSDVVESLFGKYKNFSATRPLKEIGTVILTIPLCTVKIKARLRKNCPGDYSQSRCPSLVAVGFGAIHAFKKKNPSDSRYRYKSCMNFLTASPHRINTLPDWLYVPQVHSVPDGVIRRSYTPHLKGAAVAVVMEFLSEEEGGELSVRSTPPYGKLYFYERILQVPTYVTYDPYEPTLEVR